MALAEILKQRERKEKKVLPPRLVVAQQNSNARTTSLYMTRLLTSAKCRIAAPHRCPSRSRIAHSTLASHPTYIPSNTIVPKPITVACPNSCHAATAQTTIQLAFATASNPTIQAGLPFHIASENEKHAYARFTIPFLTTSDCGIPYSPLSQPDNNSK